MRGFVIALLVVGCEEPIDEERHPLPRVTDQSGAEFFVDCVWPDCEVHRIAGVSPPEPDLGRNVRAYYAFLELRFASIGWRYADTWINYSFRYLVCQSDDDCLVRTIGYDYYECVNGFCREPDADDSLGVGIVMDLCIGDLPREVDFVPPAEIQAAVDEACPDNICERVPDECPNPF